MTYDEAERAVRAGAQAMGPCDLGSTRAIQFVAYLLVAAYRRGCADGRAEPKRPWASEEPKS